MFPSEIGTISTSNNVSALEKELIQRVRDTIGPVACFKRAIVVNRLPKTRSGKILRKLLRQIAANETVTVPSTIDDPSSVKEIETLKVGAEMIGNRVRAKIVKNKVAPPFKEAQFDIMFGQGISREGSLLDVGVDHGIVRKAGAWFTYDEIQLGQGKENSKRFLRENADIALQLETDVYKAVGMIESDESTEEETTEESEDSSAEK